MKDYQHVAGLWLVRCGHCDADLAAVTAGAASALCPALLAADLERVRVALEGAPESDVVSLARATMDAARQLRAAEDAIGGFRRAGESVADGIRRVRREVGVLSLRLARAGRL